MENEPPKDCPKTWAKNNNIRTRSINYERKGEPMKTEEQKEKLIKDDPLYYESKLIFTLQTLLQDNEENTKNPNPEFLKQIFKHSIKTYLSNTDPEFIESLMGEE